jgi:hypothetical protein
MGRPAVWIDVVEEIDYGLVEPRADGLAGGIGQAGEGNRHPVGVGATTAVERWTLPGTGTMAVVLDPDGQRIGLWGP